MSFVFRGATDVDASAPDALVITVREPRSAPCRRCLRDAEPGERVALVSYDPFSTDSPYRSASPVFVHAAGCEPYVGTAVPEQQRRRLLSVRSFDARAMMLDSDVVEGESVEPLLERLLGDGRTAYVHVHNARPGCFAVRVTRD